jgi:hypothetical protein
LPAGAEVLFDAARVSPADWMPDDVGFGLSPSRAGDPSFGNNPAWPILGFAVRAEARYDRTWDILKLAPGAENEPGRLGSIWRAGRTLRTPTFGLRSGRIHYLVRGKGQAYAAVDSHAMIAGPLHAQIVLPLDAGDSYHWVMHDLLPYAGHRAHVEFTAASGSDFAVSMVVQSEQAPGAIDPAAVSVAWHLQSARSASPEALARAYRTLFQRVLHALEQDRLAAEPELVPLAHWLVRHPELVRQVPGKQADGRAFVAEQSKVLGALRLESRLAPALWDGSGEDEHVFIRGSHKTPGSIVPRRFLEALAGPSGLSVSHGSGRLELARQLTDPAIDPFVARVFVNRVWHHLFGRGIVASVDNLGVLGERPTHPELLDHLALQFVADGWSLKRLVRALVLTRAYRMSSQADPVADQADPQDLWLHRMRLRRLDGESIRDALLALSGRLDTQLYGRSVPVFLTPFLEGRGRPESGPFDGDGRRSLYLAVRRNFLSPFLLAFDTPIPFSTVGRRTVSNVPAQALILLNDPFVHQQAALWARRTTTRSKTPEDRVSAFYEAAFSRPPRADEIASCLDFVARQAQLSGAGPDDLAPWADLAHLLLNVKEFIFLH